MITKNPVQNRPKSTTAFPLDSTKSSGLAHRPQIQFGSGASTNVATTSKGRYCLKRAQERMTRRKPMASTCDELVAESKLYYVVQECVFTHKRQRYDGF